MTTPAQTPLAPVKLPRTITAVTMRELAEEHGTRASERREVIILRPEADTWIETPTGDVAARIGSVIVYDPATRTAAPMDLETAAARYGISFAEDVPKTDAADEKAAAPEAASTDAAPAA
ncbi:MAG: hypothetical protein JWM87_785 [Candidatus Eremiobacteraeota bacterium]|nr:hypothetical protein [Candidatus Eremiobacteraeota bacterium]